MRSALILMSMIQLLSPPAWNQEAGTRLHDVTGTVVKVGTLGYGLVPDNDKGTRYAPTQLDEAFQVDGLRVRFSGVVGALPGAGRGGRVWGTPLELTKIERWETPPD